MENPLKRLKRERYQICEQAFDGVINDLGSIENPDPQTQVDIQNTALYALRLKGKEYDLLKKEQEQQQQQQLLDECLLVKQSEEQLEYTENCIREGVNNELEQQVLSYRAPRSKRSFPPIHKVSFWNDKSCKDYSLIRGTLKKYS